MAKEVSILFKVEELESVSEVGSREASGELLRDPVDIGEGDVAGWLTGRLGGTGGATGASRNGFLLLFGDVNGLDLPMVANFCVWFATSDCGCVMGGEVLGVLLGVAATKLPTNGFVLLIPLLAVSGAALFRAVEPPELRKLSEKRVSL